MSNLLKKAKDAGIDVEALGFDEKKIKAAMEKKVVSDERVEGPEEAFEQAKENLEATTDPAEQQTIVDEFVGNYLLTDPELVTKLMETMASSSELVSIAEKARPNSKAPFLKGESQFEMTILGPANLKFMTTNVVNSKKFLKARLVDKAKEASPEGWELTYSENLDKGTVNVPLTKGFVKAIEGMSDNQVVEEAKSWFLSKERELEMLAPTLCYQAKMTTYDSESGRTKRDFVTRINTNQIILGYDCREFEEDAKEISQEIGAEIPSEWGRISNTLGVTDTYGKKKIVPRMKIEGYIALNEMNIPTALITAIK